MRRLYLRFLEMLYRKVAPKDAMGINEESRREWLAGLQRSDGFISYYKYRYAQIVSTMLSGVEREEYLELVGRRKELLHLTGESKHFEEILSLEEKKKNVSIK